MNSLNSILIEGNLTKDPVTKSLNNGSKVCVFSFASNKYYKQNGEAQKETSFFNVETWGKLAVFCSEALKKGRGVRVVGRLKQDRWNDESGNFKSRVKIVAEHVELKPIFNINRNDENLIVAEPTVGLSANKDDIEECFDEDEAV